MAPADAVGRGQACLGIARRELPGHKKAFGHNGLGARRQCEGLGDLGTHDVVLIAGNRHGSKNADNRHGDHQFQQGEARCMTKAAGSAHCPLSRRLHRSQHT